VVLVDDAEEQRRVTRLVLELDGIVVGAEASTVAGVEALLASGEIRREDVVVCDYVLDDGTAQDVVALLAPRGLAPRVLIWTALCPPEVVLALAATGTRALEKAAGLDVLEAAVLDLLDG
jgi:DNA-binding NtrC family response regulator